MGYTHITVKPLSGDRRVAVGSFSMMQSTYNKLKEALKMSEISKRIQLFAACGTGKSIST